MENRIASRVRKAWLVLPLLMVAATLGACYETSYDKAVAALNADGGNTGGGGSGGSGGGGSGGGSGGGGSGGSGGGGSAFGANFSEIQAAVFTPTCATSGCHAGVNPAASLSLEAGTSYAMLVGVASSQDSGIQRVNPSNPDLSYLIQKLEGTAGSGGVMPPSGALPDADIATIRQWIAAGAVDDTAPPPAAPIRVTTLSVTPNSTLDSAPTQIIAGFDRELDASTVNANTFILEDANGVDIAANSIIVPTANPQSAVMDLAGVNLPDGNYRILLLGSGASFIMDLDANALDGEYSGSFPSGNGQAGGDFVGPFTIMAPPVAFGPTLDEIQANVFSPSCATAGCHDNTSQAAGLSLQDADTSYLELVGQFSNQTGQMNVMLVAAGDPDASYLIRKLEGTAGITGQRMPPGTPLPQSDIDIIRTWIANGAAR